MPRTYKAFLYIHNYNLSERKHENVKRKGGGVSQLIQCLPSLQRTPQELYVVMQTCNHDVRNRIRNTKK